MKTLVLPGLDGTADLLEPFCRASPSTHQVDVLSLPDSRTSGYPELCAHFSRRVSDAQRCILIAESFSGPLAILLAKQNPEVVKQLILVATFVRSPTPRIASIIPWRFAFRIRAPRFAVRRWLVGDFVELVRPVQLAAQRHAAATLARRMDSILAVDVSSDLRSIRCPILYLQATQDRVVSKCHADQISALNDRVTVRQLVGPHLILQAQPSLAWQHILEFLDDSAD